MGIVLWHDTVAWYSITLSELNPTSLAANRTLGIYFSEHHEESRAKAYYETAIADFIPKIHRIISTMPISSDNWEC